MKSNNYNGTNEYSGILRIVGVVVDDSLRNIIGYVIMIENKNQFKAYTIEQTKILLTRFKFINADISNGVIINTECSMDRMPKFNSNLNLIDNFGVLILNIVVNSNGERLGYKCMDTNGKIVNCLSKESILKLNDQGVKIINAKIFNKPSGSRVISAIKQEFTAIKVDNNDVDKKVKNNDALKWRKKAHNDKFLYKLYKSIIVQSFTKSTIYVNDKYYSRGRNGSRYLNLERETKIALKEIFTKEYNISLDVNDLKLLSEIKDLDHTKLLYSGDRLSKNTQIYLLSLAQFALNNEQIYKDILKTLYSKRKTLKTNELPDTLISKDLVSSKYLELYKYVKNIKNKYIQDCTSSEFKVTTFVKEEDIEQLGFTTVQSNSGKMIKTNAGFNKTLLYIGDCINSNYYSSLCKSSRCLGDILCIAYIEKLLNRYGDLSISDGYAEKYNMLRSDITKSIEIIITIAYMFNSVSMKEYVETIKDKLDTLGIDVNYNDISNVYYDLPKEIVIYYTSGFNVFLNDNLKYRREYLKRAKYINYRQLGVSHDIRHTLLQNDFAGTVSLVSSDRCSTEDVERLIGKLRFL